MGRVTSYGSFGTELASVITDRMYKPDQKKRGVIFSHGLNGLGWHPVNFPDPVIDGMAARGHAVIAPDLSSTSHWGNDAAQTKITDAKNFLQGSMGAKAGGVLLWCGSMGTLAGLNYLRLNPANIAAIAVGLPAVDLADLHDNAVARGITAASIEGAYGGAAAYPGVRAAHNPAEHAAEYVAWKDRVKLWRSNDDTTVIPSVVDAFGSASGIPVVNMGNVGGHVFSATFTSAVCDFLTGFN